jgi:tRNA(fMet)-specific endonuclease VapC
MQKYLLDTNILSALIKQPQSALAQKVAHLEHEICTSVIVACELRYGVEKKGSPLLAIKVESLLNEIPVLPLEYETVSQHYATLRVFLEKQGLVIGANDMLIAAHTLALDATLITANIREFKRVPQLRVENWLEIEQINS